MVQCYGSVFEGVGVQCVWLSAMVQCWGVLGFRVYGSVPLHTLAARSGERCSVGYEFQGSGLGAWGCA